MHDHNEKNKSSMMWMMVICCALPLAILFFVGSSSFSSGYLWPILIGGFIGAHIWMMFRGHGSCGKNSKDSNEESIIKK